MSENAVAECILVVDDEEMIRQTTMQMLQRRGFEALDAADGEQAVRLVRRDPQRIDLVLLDHSMPGMSGMQTLQALRELVPELPAIIITGFPTDLRDYEGADDLLQKPFSINDLASAVRRVLDDQR